MDIEALAEAMFTECVFIPNTEGLAGTRLDGSQKAWAQMKEDPRDVWRGRARRVVARLDAA